MGYALPFPSMRRITEKMLSARLKAEKQEMATVSRSEVITALHKSRREIGLTRQQSELLAFLASWTNEDDWVTGKAPISVASNYDIGQAFDIGRTRVKTLLRSLAEAGWLIHRDSPNGHRYRKNHPTDPQKSYAYGLDLSPLSSRYSEMIAAAEVAAERRREGQKLHYQVTILARRIYDLTQTGIELGLDEATAKKFGKEAHEIALQRGPNRDPDQLSPLCDLLISLLETVEKAVENISSSSLPEKSIDKEDVESDPMGPQKKPRYTNTNQNKNKNTNVDVETRFARKNVKKEIGEGKSALRGFEASPQFLMTIAPALKAHISGENESDFIDGANLLGYRLGISQQALAESKRVLGKYETAVAIAIISSRRDEIKFPGGYLRGMIAKHREGELFLDRTLKSLKSLEQFRAEKI